MNIPLKIFSFVIAFSTFITAQELSIKGVVRDSADNSPCIGANIALTKIFPETNSLQFTTTNSSGYFDFEKLTPGRYLLQITHVGYNKFEDTIRLFRREVNLGSIYMAKTPIQLEQVEVIGNIIQAEQIGDTIQYLAKGFKTSKDAVAEELITKIPGVQREEGKIKAQGEEVKQILVDGKPFFGEDPDIALRNLPAEIIEKIQVYDRLSDQAQFTGFDDGQTSKTINIITRTDRQRGQFGKLYGGYGTDGRYLSGGNINLFSQQQRISIIGLVNNINQQNFSAQDLLLISGGQSGRQFRAQGIRGGFQGRGSWGGSSSENFLVGNQEGNNNTYSLGFNYADAWGSDFTINGSYFFNHTKNINDQIINREYFAEPLSSQFYNENFNSSSKNFNYRINMRVEYNFDSLNSVILTPRLYFQDNSSENTLTGFNYLNLILNNSTNNSNSSDKNGYNLSNELLLRHKFELPGRTISLNLNTGINRRNSENQLYSLSRFISSSFIDEDTTDQLTNQLTKGYNISSDLNYTEPIGENAQLQASFSANFSRNKSDKKANLFNPTTNFYENLDSLLSNEYQNDYRTLRGGLSYRYRNEEFNLSAGFYYQQSNLKGEQIFPLPNVLRREYSRLLPNARLQYKFSETSNLRINYNSGLNPPSISQLQNTPDNTNSLFLRSGNPNLDVENNHRISARYLHADLKSGSSFFAMIFFNYVNNHIGNMSINALKDTLLPSEIFLRKGSQLTYPINFEYSYSTRAFVNAGFPIHPIKCYLNLSTAINFSLTPGQLNEVKNFSKSYSISQGVMLNSNISEEIDFRLSYSPIYNITRNDKQSELNRDYFVHNASAGFYWLFLERFYVRTDFNFYYNTGISQDLKQKYYLWNASAGVKLFDDKSGEIKFETFDIFDQNKSLGRTITETYIEDKSTRVLQRYFMLSFIYYLRIFRE